MNTEYVEKNSEGQFLEAHYDSSDNVVAIFGNAKGLDYLQSLIDDLIRKGVDGSHYHLENFSGLDGSVDLILGRRMKRITDLDRKPSNEPNWELPKDIPDEVISLVNEGKPLEAMRIFIKAKNVNLAEARYVVECLYNVRQAGIVLTLEQRKNTQR